MPAFARFCLVALRTHSHSAQRRSSPRKATRPHDGSECEHASHGDLASYHTYNASYMKPEHRRLNKIPGNCKGCEKEFVTGTAPVDEDKCIKVGGNIEVRACRHAMRAGKKCDHVYCSKCWAKLV